MYRGLSFVIIAFPTCGGGGYRNVTSHNYITKLFVDEPLVCGTIQDVIGTEERCTVISSQPALDE